MTQVVASLVDGSVKEASASSRVAFRAGADLVELRLDHLDGFSIGSIREARTNLLGPAIATLRSKLQGGRSGLTGSKREDALVELLAADFEYIDLELDTDRGLLRDVQKLESSSEIIASYHFQKPASRDAVEEKLAEALALGHVAKVAMPCDDAGQALELAQLGLKYSRMKKRFVLIGMGEQGQLTRVFADRIGSSLAFASMPGKPAAPGQLDIIEQLSMLSGSRLVFGLIGHPVSHSVSKPMQEAALGRLGLGGMYLPLDIPPKVFDGNTLRLLRNLGFAGLNVTIPHKGTAFRLCDRVGEPASATRAVNTMKFTGSSIQGENTDVFGFSRLLEGKSTITRSTNALIVGAGGAARAVAYVLSERGAILTVTDIERSRAEELARTYRAKAVPLKKLWSSERSFDLVINCSPVGMKGVAGLPIRAGFVRPGSVYIDVVYNPEVTQAMELATRRGAKSFGGLEMLVQQGAESFRIWTGLEPDVDAMRKAAREALS